MNSIFVTIRKSGTKSFQKFKKKYPQLNIEPISRRNAKEFSKHHHYKVFIICRNPYSRAISSWQRARFLNHHMFKTDITQPNLNSFKNFLREIITVKERHWRPQRVEALMFEKFEPLKIEEATERFAKLFGSEFVFPHEHSHLTEKKKLNIYSYRDFCDDEARELIEKSYKLDAEMFGYVY